MPKLIESKTTHRGRLFAMVHETYDFDGTEVTLEIARRAPGCRLIVRNDKGEFLITRERRRELNNAIDLRLPGGKVFDRLEDYESALQSGAPIEDFALKAVMLEGAQEAGICVEKADLLAISKCGASVDWDLFYYAVTGWSPRKEGQDLEIGEDIAITWMTPAAVQDACLDGRIGEERSAIQLLRLLRKEKSNVSAPAI